MTARRAGHCNGDVQCRISIGVRVGGSCGGASNTVNGMRPMWTVI